MHNLTQYPDDELSRLVYTTELLYEVRHTPELWEMLESMYSFSESHRVVLEYRLERERDER